MDIHGGRGLSSAGLQFQSGGPGYLSRLINTFSPNFLVRLRLLLPLGVVGLKRLPRAWVIRSHHGRRCGVGARTSRETSRGQRRQTTFDVIWLHAQSRRRNCWLSAPLGARDSYGSTSIRLLQDIQVYVCNMTPEKLRESE